MDVIWRKHLESLSSKQYGSKQYGRGSQSMATFHPFLSLPYELRAQIWEMAVEPRIVDVRVKRISSQDPEEGQRLVSTTPAPAMLHVCREARNSRLYQKAFEEIATEGFGAQYVWVNLEIDIIDVKLSALSNYGPVAPLIQRLKFNCRHTSEYFFRFEGKEIWKFTNVKEILIVALDGIMSCDRADRHIWPCGWKNLLIYDSSDGKMYRSDEIMDAVDAEIAARGRAHQLFQC